jgi:Putative restriction endonuclease
MSIVKGDAWTNADYERAAEEYRRTLPLEHFIESEGQATQREITLASLALVKARRTDVQVFNERLVQYFFDGELQRVVPDNMVRLCDQPPLSKGSFNPEKEPVGALLVLEYVSPKSEGKDYEESFSKYERELKVPYCLMYYPEREDLKVWRHNDQEYELIPANAQGRFAIAALELEVGLVDGWVRYWFQGELLPLPAELLHRAEQADRRAEEANRRAEQERQRAEQERQRAEQERQRAEQERQRAEAAEMELARLREILAKTKKEV